MHAPLFRIKKLTHPSTPGIYTKNWDKEHSRGWRWETNVSITPVEDACDLVEALQEIHGKGNVAVGQPFNDTLLKPIAMPAFCGIYIRDVEDIVSTFVADLDKWNKDEPSQ